MKLNLVYLLKFLLFLLFDVGWSTISTLIVSFRSSVVFFLGCWRVVKFPGQKMNDLSRPSPSIPLQVLDYRWSPQDIREKKRQMISLTPFIRKTKIRHASVLFRFSILFNTSHKIWSQRLAISRLFLEKNQTKISESFFKRVGSYKSSGKVSGLDTEEGKDKEEKPPFHVVSCKSKWIWISQSRRWWRKRSHRQHTTNSDSLI